MAMGQDDGQQPTLFLTYNKLRGLGHPFYDALDRLLRGQGFDRFVEGLCAPFYAEVMGRPGLAPGVILVRRLLKRASFASLDDLRLRVLAFIDYFNQHMAKPFRWTYKGKLLAA